MIPNGFSGIPCKGFWDQKIDKIKFQTDVHIIYSSEVCATTKLKMGTNISLQSYMSLTPELR